MTVTSSALNGYKMDIGSGDAIDVVTNNVTFDGLAFEMTGGASALDIASANADVNVSNCIVYGGTIQIYARPTAGTVNVWNCAGVAANISADGAFRVSGGTAYVYNSTFINVNAGGYGVYQSAGTIHAKNNYASAGGNDYAGTFATKTTCASADATGSVGLTSIAYTTANFKNVTSGSEDPHLTNSSGLRGEGTDLSGDSNLPFSDDIDGDTRPTGGWDIGADQDFAPGAPGTLYTNNTDAQSGDENPTNISNATPHF